MKRSKDEVAYQTASLKPLVFLKDVVREEESKQEGSEKVWSIGRDEKEKWDEVAMRRW